MTNPLHRHTLTESAHLIAQGTISSTELIQSYLDQISRMNPTLNAFITVLRDQALQDAKSADEAINNNKPLGSLHGVPIAIKDQVHTAGIATTSASKIRSAFVPEKDATVVERLKNAGAIIIGKLNMTEFAMGDPVTSHYGITHNPWGLGRDPGTSSTGAGSATAAFMTAASIGEDTGGSIRGPAAHCGLAGIRPSWGLVSRFGLDGASWSLDTLGPLGRTVEDVAQVLQAIAGYDPLDPTTSTQIVPEYTSAMTGNISGMRIAVLHEFVDGPRAKLHPAVRQSIEDAIGTFKSLGAVVDTISIPNANHAGTASRTISFVERVSIHPEWIRERPQDFHPNTRTAFLTGELIPAQAYYKAQKMRDLIRSDVFAVLQNYDVIIMPTDESPAGVMNPEPGFKTVEAAKEGLRKSMYRGLFSAVSGPAISIPSGFAQEGGFNLPVGLQIASMPFREDLVFKCAHAFEQATKWHQQDPPNC